jgi:hypothetical protein
MILRAGGFEPLEEAILDYEETEVFSIYGSLCGGRRGETRWIEGIVSGLQPPLLCGAAADPMSPNVYHSISWFPNRSESAHAEVLGGENQPPVLQKQWQHMVYVCMYVCVAAATTKTSYVNHTT